MRLYSAGSLSSRVKFLPARWGGFYADNGHHHSLLVCVPQGQTARPPQQGGGGRFGLFSVPSVISLRRGNKVGTNGTTYSSLIVVTFRVVVTRVNTSSYKLFLWGTYISGVVGTNGKGLVFGFHTRVICCGRVHNGRVVLNMVGTFVPTRTFILRVKGGILHHTMGGKVSPICGRVNGNRTRINFTRPHTTRGRGTNKVQGRTLHVSTTKFGGFLHLFTQQGTIFRDHNKVVLGIRVVGNTVVCQHGTTRVVALSFFGGLTITVTRSIIRGTKVITHKTNMFS